MSKLIPIACLALIGAPLQAYAQQQGSDDKPVTASAPPVQQVTITNSRASDMDERRNATAGKQVYGREELDRNGDSNLGDVLKRLPGVTIGGGRPGRGGDVRMRGLGNGYTQVLVNGERPPAGFSMESLAPDQVERVEVMRGPVAEHSARAIAGTINIVLRDGYQQKDLQVKLADGVEQGLHSPNLSLTLPGKQGTLSYTLSGTLGINRQHNEGHGTSTDTRADGTVERLQLQDDDSSGTTKNLNLAPRVSYKFDNGDTLNFQAFVMAMRSDTGATSALRQPAALPGVPAQEYATADTQSHASTTFMRGFGNWVHRLQGASKLDVKFGFGLGRRDSDALRYQYDAKGSLLDRFTDTDASRDRGVNLGGKYTSPLGQGHLLAAGWEVETGHREQTRVALDKNGASQFADSGDNLTADTRRVALYAQDEWDITPAWSVYGGVRWEGIRTTSERGAGSAGNVNADTIRNNSSVLSPLLHGVWRIPGQERDQVRLSWTKSYKSPNVQDLIALPALSRNNDATRPDRTGNPNLKPELATGIDLAYEHYLGRAGIVSASAFIRDIDDLIRRTLTTYRAPDGTLRWISTPSNVGHAKTKGIELEAKFQLAEWFAEAPAIDVRANYSRFWSRVDGIPGPDNRLDQQAKQTGNLGLDYRMKDAPLTFGASFNWTPSIRVQSSTEQVVEVSRKRVLDAYVLWKATAFTQVRLSASNMLADDAIGNNLVMASAGGKSVAKLSSTVNPTYPVWSVRLETKF
ncbi:MAG: TonB-dependent receptor [Burkholderiaceae bacterium]|nr:TonB-dependent receptor [Burkholderiaceae bacterium]